MLGFRRIACLLVRLYACMLGFCPHSGGHHAHSTRSGKQREIVLVCLCGTSLVAWLREFRRTLEIITRTLREVVNRVRLCGQPKGITR